LMPVRNAEVTLPATLRSIQQQSHGDWQLVAVDDFSTDGSRRILEALAAVDSRVVYLAPQGAQGIVPALLRGLEVIASPLIARMDADDLMHPQRLEKQLQFLEQHPEIGLVSSQVRYEGQGRGYALHVDWINSLQSPEQMVLRRFVESPVAHPSVMFRAGLLRQFGSYQEGAFPEDYELWLRWLQAGVRFGKHADVLLTWTDPEGRLSRTDGRYGPEAFYEVKCRFLAQWLKENLPVERQIWLWGAGRVTRKRFRFLQEAGIQLGGLIDVDPGKVQQGPGVLPCLIPPELPELRDSFILAGVANHGAREQIDAYLRARHWLEGRDYLLVA